MMNEKYYIWDEGRFINRDGGWESAFGSSKEIDAIILRRAYLFDSIEYADSFACEHGINRCVFLSVALD